MKKQDKFYLTTAIVYASRRPHIGNDYEFIFADSIARFNRQQGKDVYFLTGSDEHGQKIEELACGAGTSPQQYVDTIVSGIKKNDALLNISYDQFIRTTDPAHMRVVQKIFKKMEDRGDIYKGEYKGMYCTPCEAFWTESQLINGCCPDCARPVKKAREEAYFFKMSNYSDRLMHYIDEHPEFILPVSRKNEMVNNFLKPGLQDLCITRTSFEWGIPVREDPKHIVYVWLDALVNYISAMGYDPDGSSAQFKKYWPADVHIIGKDILRFHTIYWPIFLMSLDLPLPKTIFGHPWLLFGSDKMSKSLGNVLYSADLAGFFTVDGVRYYALSEMPYDKDGSITIEAAVSKYNSDLANTLGNLLSRTTAMAHKYFGGTAEDKKVAEPVDSELRNMAVKTAVDVRGAMAYYRTADALESVMSFARRCNKYIDETVPWILAKEESKKDRLSTVLYNLLEGVRFIGVMLAAFMPETSEKILQQLHAEDAGYPSLAAFGAQARFSVEQAGALFARIDEAKFLEDYYKPLQEGGEKMPEEKKIEEKSMITIDEFDKVQLRVAEVIACEKVEKADKLLKLTVRLGEETRTVVSGIAKNYTPEEMVGKKVVLVANLAPAKLRGIESCGMILCASDDKGNVILVSPEKNIESGSEVF